MRFHFLHRHIGDTVIILREVNLPHPLCPRCEMLVPWKFLNGQHVITAQCDEGVERKIRWFAAEEMRDNMVRAFQDYSRPNKTVTSFKYLGRIITALDNNYLSVVGDLQNARYIWVLSGIHLRGKYKQP